MTATQRAPRPATPPPGGRGSLPALGLAVAVLCAFQLYWAFTIDSRASKMLDAVAELRQSVEELEEAAGRTETAALRTAELGDRLTLLEERVAALGPIADEWDIVVDDLQRLDGKLSKLVVAFEQEFGIEVDNPAIEVPELDWTEPSLFEAARSSAESVGITLTAEEIRVPSRFELREGFLEYFAVLKGGKRHESLISLLGNTPEDQTRPAEFGAKLNNAILALGYRRGKPIRLTAAGTRPAEGETIYLFLEWEENGETVVARAEDLIWNRMTGAAMEPGHWVYVGSSYVPGDEAGSTLFAADLTAEAVATYSAINTIIDNTSDGAADDTVFLVATPRIPEGITKVDFILRREDLTDTKVFEVGGPVLEEDEADAGEDDAGADR